MRTTEECFRKTVGPRRVGGVYRNERGEKYTVLEINRDLPTWYEFEIVCQDEDGTVRRHCTPWNPKRDTVVKQP